MAFLVSGRVQGVGYRWFGCRAANEVGVTGWIRNRPDGGVEGEAFGEPDALETFFRRLRLGPAAGRVDRLERHEILRTRIPDGFETRY